MGWGARSRIRRAVLSAKSGAEWWGVLETVPFSFLLVSVTGAYVLDDIFYAFRTWIGVLGLGNCTKRKGKVGKGKGKDKGKGFGTCWVKDMMGTTKARLGTTLWESG